jgi:hypothetical protein
MCTYTVYIYVYIYISKEQWWLIFSDTRLWFWSPGFESIINLPILQWIVSPDMGCALGWLFPVSCPLRGGIGEYKNNRHFCSTKKIKEQKISISMSKLGKHYYLYIPMVQIYQENRRIALGAVREISSSASSSPTINLANPPLSLLRNLIILPSNFKLLSPFRNRSCGLLLYTKIN